MFFLFACAFPELAGVCSVSDDGTILCVDDTNVIDLMEALKKSLKGGGGLSREKADRFLEAHGRKPKPRAKKARRKTTSRKRAA